MIFLIVADDKVDVSSISLSQESTILIVYAKRSAFSLITVVIYIMDSVETYLALVYLSMLPQMHDSTTKIKQMKAENKQT